MKKVLNPSSVAIVGASNDETKLGGMVTKNMINAGFDTSKLYPINPKGGQIMGLKAYTSIAEVGQPVDLAVVAVKAPFVPAEITKLGNAGVKFATILTAGFKEDSPAGAELEKQLVAAAKESGIRILGPNCFGLMNPGKGVNATFAHLLPRAGNISIFSQSGAVGSSIIDWAFHNKVGIGNFITLGNKADIDEADLLGALSEDPNTKVIGMYCEGISNGDKFIKAVESMPNKKPIVVFKSGRTLAGSAAASSHTGSLAGSDAVNNVVFKKLNIHRAMDLDELFDALAVFSTCPLMKKDGIAIITNAGGLGVMSADAAFDAPDINAVKFSDETIAEIKRRVPTVAGLTNPIDVRGDAKAEYFKEVIDIVTKDPNVGGLVIMGSPLDTADLESVARSIVEIKDSIPVPTTICFAGGTKCARANDILKEGKLPTYPTPDRAVRALSILRHYTKNAEKQHDPLKLPEKSGRGKVSELIAKARAEGRGSLTESEGLALLASYDFPIPGEGVARSEQEAASECDRITYPTVMKILSPDIQHKTDVGGVVLGIKNAEEAAAAYAKIMASCKVKAPNARLDGVSIQQMVSGQEVILSMVRDSQFGPVVSFGLGGVYVEILREISQAHAPMSEQQLEEMVKSTKAYKLLSGARGLPAADVDAIMKCIRIIVRIALENPEIRELEINPVIVGLKGKGCWAADCLCTLVKE